jgi:hypothetical protein
MHRDLQEPHANKSCITVEPIDGVWWLVDPADGPFVSVGVNHVQGDCWLAPYNRRQSLDRFGADLAAGEGKTFNPDGQAIIKVMDWVKARMGEMHFNTLGIHTYGVPAQSYMNDVYYCLAVEAFPLGSGYRFSEQTFPDIFSEDFEQLLERTVQPIARTHRHSPGLIGYAYSDIPRWYFFGDKGKAQLPHHPWVSDILNLPAKAAGKRRCVEILQQRYPSAAALAETYGLEAESWQDVADCRDWPETPQVDRTRDDGDALLRALVERWYSLHAEVIRRHDPDHLLLGDKLHSPHRLPAWFPDILRRWVDVVLVQWYCPFDQQQGTLAELHRQTGKPILNGDSCFACPKPPRQTKVKGTLVQTQEAVGDAYRRYLRELCSQPFMLGWHHCGFVEQWDGGKDIEWQLNENGFFDPFLRPHEQLVAEVSAANAQAHAWHGQSSA